MSNYCLEPDCYNTPVPTCCWCTKHCFAHRGKEYAGQHYPRIEQRIKS